MCINNLSSFLSSLCKDAMFLSDRFVDRLEAQHDEIVRNS